MRTFRIDPTVGRDCRGTCGHSGQDPVGHRPALHDRSIQESPIPMPSERTAAAVPEDERTDDSPPVVTRTHGVVRALLTYADTVRDRLGGPADAVGPTDAPAGPIDPDVGVLAARAPDGELLGLFVNFACHLTVVGGPGFTADYVYYLRETLRRHYKRPDLPVGFLLGAAGDVTQVDNQRPGREFGEEWGAIFGLALSAEVAQTVARMNWSDHAVLGAKITHVDIPIRDDREVDREKPELGLGAGSVAERIYARERQLVAEERAKHPIIPCEIQAIRIGELSLVTNGAEFFCRLGLDIKAASPFRRTWVVTLANQWIGYVATPNAFYAGGYEPRTARSAKMAPWAGQSIVETSLSALGLVKKQAG